MFGKRVGKIECYVIYPVILSLILASCAPYKTVQSGRSIDTPPEAGRESNTLRSPYLLSEGDQIEINVARQDKLTRTAVIDSTGHIDMPYVGDIQACGLTVAQLREEITKRLSKYYVDPQVDINVKNAGGQQVFVLGEVASPGSFDLNGRVSAWKAIALARGFTQDANMQKVILLRNENNVITASLLNLDLQHIDKTEDGITPARNVYLQRDDILYVTPKKIGSAQRFMSSLQMIIAAFIPFESAIVFGPQVLEALGLRSTGGGGASTGMVVTP